MPNDTKTRIITPQIMDWSGNKKSLSHGQSAYIFLDSIVFEKDNRKRLLNNDNKLEQNNINDSSNKKLLILGLGALCPNIPLEYSEVFYVECPEFEQALANYYNANSQDDISSKIASKSTVPEHWVRISVEQAIQMCRDCHIMLYRQNLRLFPDFWAPLWGIISQKRLMFLHKQARVQNMLILGDNDSLLTRELIYAFETQGFKVRCIDANLMLNKDKSWSELLQDERPSLVFAVNAQGFDSEGELFYLLEACKIPVAFWFTDNPWYILTRFKTPWWKNVFLYCTDHSFIPALRQMAKKVEHLPLAFAPHMWLDDEAAPSNNFANNTVLTKFYNKSLKEKSIDFEAIKTNKILFLGGLAFPSYKSFFAASKIPDVLLKKSISLLKKGGCPDFNWWVEQLGVDNNLWPGNTVRNTGLGAGLCSAYNRLYWIGEAYNVGLSFFGHSQDESILHNIISKLNAIDDKHMHDLLPKLIKNMQAPVDYYTILPLLYAYAPYTLNVTSMLLPSGLTQRHFDVWACGGFLLTNITDGLQIFPKELTDEISLGQPKDMQTKINRFESNPALRKDLQSAWRDILLKEHSYECRMQKVCNEAIAR